MKALVTGGCGFIGSNLCSRLLGNGQRVIGIDDFSRGDPGSVLRLQDLSGDRYGFVESSICDKAAVRRLMSSQIDVVVHLAAQVSVQESFSDKRNNDRINIDGFKYIL